MALAHGVMQHHDKWHMLAREAYKNDLQPMYPAGIVLTLLHESSMSLANIDLEQSLLSYQADAPTQNSWRGEVKTLLALSAPVTVQLSSQYAIHVISQSFIGHRGATSLAAAAIGHTV